MQMQLKVIHLASLLSVCLAGAGCSVEGNGQIVSRDVTVGGFTKVKSILPINMTIKESASFSMTVSTDSNLQSLITATTVGDTLEVGATSRISPSDASSIQITLPEFRGATLTNSGKVAISEIAAGRDVALLNSGAAQLSLAGSVNTLQAELTGVGPIDLEGNATSLDAKLSGHTGINARPLVSTNVRLVTTDPSSTGSIVATVNGGTAFISLGGIGDITLHGTASQLEQEDTGSGSIHIVP
jgi:hypothetical protein